MAISVAVLVGEATANALIAKLIPKIEALKIGPASDRSSDMGALVTAQHLAKVRGYVDQGEKEGAKLVVDGRGSRRRKGTRVATLSVCTTRHVDLEVGALRSGAFDRPRGQLCRSSRNGGQA